MLTEKHSLERLQVSLIPVATYLVLSLLHIVSQPSLDHRTRTSTAHISSPYMISAERVEQSFY